MDGKLASLAFVFEAERLEPDVGMIFLSNREGATLGTACERGDTDFHVTGATHAVAGLVTSKPKEFRIDLSADTFPNGVYASSAAGGANTADFNDRMRLNLTTSRVALGIDGTVGNTMTGQSSVSLMGIFENAAATRSTAVGVSYMNWLAIGNIVNISNPKIIDSATGETVVPHFVTDGDVDTACATSQAALESMYTQGNALREFIVYQPAPPLSKTVMRVPYGIDGTTFDSVCNVVDRPTAMSDAAFESMAHACLAHTLAIDETGDPEVSMEAFMAETKVPGIKASKYAEKVVNTLSMIVNLVCPYRIDGRTAVLPTGLSMVGSESWKAEAPRNLFSFDDCDGSGAIQTSLLYRAETIARDPKLAASHPHVAGIANALVHHMVGICVLAANAGQADAAGKGGHEAVAGHAIAMAIPKLMAHSAMITGIKKTGSMSKDADKAAKSVALAESLREPMADALYHVDDVDRMDKSEQRLLESTEGRQELAEALNAEAYALEGTSPVASGRLYEPKPSARLDQVGYAKTEKALEAAIGPGVTRAVTRLHVPVDHSGPDHQFYKHFVEFSVPLRRYGTWLNKEMREGGVATAEWVFTSADDVQHAGVSPKDLATGNFLMLPLWKLDTAACTAMDVASDEVLANTIPVRAGPVRMTVEQSKAYESNLAALKELDAKKRSLFNAKKHASRHIIAFAVLVGNSDSLPLFTDTLMSDPHIACRVTFTPVSSVLLSPDGVDVGTMPYIELMAL